MSLFDQLITRIWTRKVPFFTVFFLITLVSYGILFAIDFIPEPITKVEEAETVESVSTPVSNTENITAEAIAATAVLEAEPIAEGTPVIDPLPTKIIFDTLDKEIEVLNPASRDIADLDAALLEGVVRHPDSADFSDPGNIFILGHSSYLPNVFNRNYQALNGIQDLDWGDTIRLQSGSREYTYFVEEVYEAKASEVVVPFTPGKANLTLATCDSFGSLDDRFIVEAKLISERQL